MEENPWCFFACKTWYDFLGGARGFSKILDILAESGFLEEVDMISKVLGCRNRVAAPITETKRLTKHVVAKKKKTTLER